MNPLILAVLLAGQYPLLQEAQKQKANSIANSNEKALQRANELTRLRSASSEPPGATEALTGPLTFRFVAPDGRTFSFAGSGTLTIEGGSTPTPIPPPVGTTLTGVRSTDTGMLVTTAPSGTRLLLTGTNLTEEGTLYTVAIGGEKAQVLRATTELIEFRAPPVPVGKTPVLILYWLIGNSWVEKGRLPFEVTAAVDPTPIPPEPPIPIPPEPIPIPPDPNPPLQGENPRIDSIAPAGGRVVLTGGGFGAVTGQVMLDKRPLSVVAWTEARIECLQGQESVFVNVVVDLYRPGTGWYTESFVPLVAGRK